MMAGCGRKTERNILPEDVTLREGDIVLRRGGGITSHAVLMADTGGEYSHIGIVADSAGMVVIIHAVPGEPDFEGDVDRVKMDSPQQFFSSVNASRGCVVRCSDGDAARRAAREAMAIYRRHTLFDHDYDDSDTTRMYCCELVERAYTLAGVPLIGRGRHNIHLPAINLRGVAFPSDFFGPGVLHKVAEF